MSSLIFATDESQILVATDTLAVTPDGEPFCFASKATHVPHLRTIIAGTGGGGLSNEWALTVSARMIVRGIRNLNYHTPIGLRDLWETYRQRYSLDQDLTTTVYQFGISEEDNKVVSFAYRSTNNFESEQLPYGTGVKPECNVPEGNLIEVIPSMMHEQRSREASKPAEARLYIGGEIFAHYLTKDECRCFSLGEFEGFEANQRRIFENYDKG
ncbi:MAG: hypothetical protein ABJ360_05025 [Roseobacter sp.]|uniref:hypothetical protein n=1 Tax=Marinobacter TaxID=2742 RepID=UPI002943E51D|nr:hypothetical protein [Marinobacter salarius]WOI17511.1 hypothetical protein R1T46_11925 [Marinobacter salarius]